MTTFSFQTSRFSRYFFLRTEIDRLLTASIFFSCLLVAIRILHTGSTLFIMMIWNLFLAYIPYALSSWLTKKPQRRRLVTIAVSIIWLLFIPNSF
ncbi:MAG TPA: DUF1361 domain-containing protein, partial [Puia sp.]|nr:DUF1361 domain-containing protein [Puia sp.]